MIAGIYARKSTKQDRDAEDKSVATQIENARAFAAARGWTVDDAHVYADDATSGAETSKLTNRQRLLDAIGSGDPPFGALLMRDPSRFSRRDGDEAFGQLKAIAKAGVEIHFYGDCSRFEYGTLATNVVGFMRSEIAAEYRRQIAAMTAETLRRKARAGHVTGGRVFGYDIVSVNSHKERRVNAAEAAIVLRAHELYAGGAGYAAIANALNAEGAPAPRTWKDPTSVWSAGSVRELVNRRMYRGEVVYGQTKKRNVEGKVDPTRRAPSDWIRVPAPALQILPLELADAVAARVESMRARSLHGANGRLRGRPAGEGSPYALVGLLRCGVCGGSMEVVSRKSGARRAFAYRCYRSRRQGANACSNRLPIPMAHADDAVLVAVEKTLLNPAVVERALALAEAELLDDGAARRRAPLAADLAALDAEVERLTTAIKRGGDLDPLLAALRASEARRGELRQQIAALDAEPRTTPLDAGAVRAKLRSYVEDYRKLLRGHVPQMQQILRRLVVGKLTFTPKLNGDYEFAGRGTVRPLLSGVIRNLASPMGLAGCPTRDATVRIAAL
jgi:DNA invertase Pin-like site-specific DNA recombinase